LDICESFGRELFMGMSLRPRHRLPLPRLRGRAGRGLSPHPSCSDCLDEAASIRDHIEIAETQDTVTLCGKKCIALGIARMSWRSDRARIFEFIG